MTFRWMSSNTRALAGRKIDRFNVSSARGSANFGGWTVGCSRLAHHSQHQHTPHKVSRPAFSTACASFRPGAVQCGLTSARGWNLEFQHCFSGTSSSTSRVVEDLNLGFNVHQARFSSDASAAAVGGGKVRGFSSSSDSSPTSPPTSPQNTGGKEKVVMETVEDAGMPRNEDDVSADATVPKEPRHSHILVPDITDVSIAFGRWLLGQYVSHCSTLCPFCLNASSRAGGMIAFHFFSSTVRLTQGTLYKC